MVLKPHNTPGYSYMHSLNCLSHLSPNKFPVKYLKKNKTRQKVAKILFLIKISAGFDYFFTDLVHVFKINNDNY